MNNQITVLGVDSIWLLTMGHKMAKELKMLLSACSHDVVCILLNL